MRCPNCDATILDTDAAFCPRCATPLGAPEAEATTELKPDLIGDPSDSSPEQRRDIHDTLVGAGSSASLRPVEASESPRPADSSKAAESSETAHSSQTVEPEESSGPPFVHDFLVSIKRALRKGAWGPLTVAAAFGFLSMLAAAALLILGVKMQYPDIGSGSDPLHSLSALVIVALGVIRTPIGIGDLSVSALPLGALIGVGYLLVWATSRALRRKDFVDVRTSVAEGVKLAVPFALICFIAALVFRIRAEPTPVGADAGAALVLGAIWGAVFGAVGGLLAAGTARTHLKNGLEMIRSRWEFVFHGLVAGGTMLGVSFVLGAVAALFWVIAGLLAGGPTGFGLGEAGAAVIYLVAFAPNVIVSILAVALGAPVEIGAQVSSAGRLLGPLSEVSLFEWGGGDPPWFAYLLLVIPVVACLAGGFAAHRSARRGATETSKLMLPTLVVAAATYAFVLFELAALAEARLGAGLIRNRGFGRVAPDAGTVLVVAAAWAFFVGLVGWKLVESGTVGSGDAKAASVPNARPHGRTEQPEESASPADEESQHRGTPPLS